MTLSELHAIMTGGFCTIAGGVFALYVGFGVEAGHLMVASVMAVPAGLVCTKILWPETEESETMGTVARTAKSEAKTSVEAAANGAVDGLKLALNVGAMLIAFLGIVAVINWVLGEVPMWGDDPLSLERILSWLFAPVAAVMGVPAGDIMNLSELLGMKIVLTELIAYQGMGEMVAAGEITPRTKMIASFALCGFANLGSIAIQIGGLGAMAPERKSEIAKLAVRAMWAGAVATCMTACLAGLMG
jgi:CNT family concentrative nucleoside transporter